MPATRSQLAKFETVDGAFTIVSAPDETEIAWPFTMWDGVRFALKNDHLTIKTLERTVVYKLKPQTPWQRVHGVRSGVKVYDDEP